MDTLEKVITVGPFLGVTLGIFVLFIGKRLNDAFGFLREFNIPEPVTGGIIFSLLLGLIYALSGVTFEFDLSGRDFDAMQRHHAAAPRSGAPRCTSQKVSSHHDRKVVYSRLR